MSTNAYEDDDRVYRAGGTFIRERLFPDMECPNHSTFRAGVGNVYECPDCGWTPDRFHCVDCGETFVHARDAHDHAPHPHGDDGREEPGPGKPSQNSTGPAEDAETDAESEEDTFDLTDPEPYEPEPEDAESDEQAAWWRFWQ